MTFFEFILYFSFFLHLFCIFWAFFWAFFLIFQNGPFSGPLPEVSFTLENRLRFWCGLALRVRLRPSSSATRGRGWKSTKLEIIENLRDSQARM